MLWRGLGFCGDDDFLPRFDAFHLDNNDCPLMHILEHDRHVKQYLKNAWEENKAKWEAAEASICQRHGDDAIELLKSLLNVNARTRGLKPGSKPLPGSSPLMTCLETQRFFEPLRSMRTGEEEEAEELASSFNRPYYQFYLKCERMEIDAMENVLVTRTDLDAKLNEKASTVLDFLSL